MVTIDSVMDFYNSNKDNFDSLIDTITKGLVTPFIGAGMSYFVYPQWKEVLKEFADLVNDSSSKEQVMNYINNGNTIAAANALEYILGNKIISDKLPKIFNKRKLDDCSDTEIFAAPISLLPLILPDASVITTNYDHVLECVYKKCEHEFTDGTFTPYSKELTSQFLQKRPHCLYKIHGRIDTDTIDYSSIIFTESQYDERYNNTDSIGRKSLTNLYLSHTMLFLGCSLDKDRTLDLFQSVCKDSGSGLKHFAILQCEEKGNLDSRAKELTDKYNIFPIFYQGDHNESIRAILEEILRIINSELYRQHTTPKPIGKNKFLYNSGAVKFCGRDRELKICREFAQSEDKLQYMIIEGAGGSGKSRLAFEFGNELKNNGWGVKELKSENYEDLSKLADNITENKLFIADYAARCSDKLSDLIERLSNKINDSIPYKVRIIMLERDSENDDLSNNSFKASNWKQSFDNRKIKEFLFTNDEMQNNVLKLNVLDDNALCQIMKSFAESDGKTLDDNTADKLLEALKRVDQVLLRPLFALFIVYAWCSGE
ncbi:MAG: SIR2 family protein, partial [Acutalibacteraceae bacterium]